MTTHQRNFPSIDPAEARAAGRDGGQGGIEASTGAGPVPDRAGRGAASGAAHRSRSLQGRRRPGDADPLRRGDHARRAIVSLPMRASTARQPGSMRASARPSRPTPRGSPSSATIRCCCRTKTRPRSRAPTRPIRSPTSRRWRRSPASTSTGTSSPTRPPRGRSGSFRETRRTSPSAGWRRRSSPRLASTMTIRFRPGMRITLR